MREYHFFGSRRTHRPSGAFTLLELLIVLGLVIALTGMGVPTLFRMQMQSRLTGTARELQSELYRTRLEAMKSGAAYVFRYRLGSSEFEILPKSVFDQRQTNLEGFGATSVGPELLTLEEEPEPSNELQTDIYRRQLPFQIIFTAPSGQRPGEWSVPILFFPNGRTSQTTLTISTTGRLIYHRQLTLRGLTGTAMVSSP